MKNNCFAIFGSWTLLFIGFFLYDVGGVMYGVAPLLAAAVLRGDRDELVKGELWKSRTWLIFMLFYYGIIFVLALDDPSNIRKSSMIVSVLIIGFPVFLNIFIRDFKICASKGR